MLGPPLFLLVTCGALAFLSTVISHRRPLSIRWSAFTPATTASGGPVTLCIRAWPKQHVLIRRYRACARTLRGELALIDRHYLLSSRPDNTSCSVYTVAGSQRCDKGFVKRWTMLYNILQAKLQ